MSPASILSLTGLPSHPVATVGDIETAERDLGVHLPEDYKAFLRESDGIEGFSGPDGDYLMLWGVQELGENNRGYEVAKFAPGLTLIGSDGGGNAFGFMRNGGRTTYVRIPFIPMDLDEAEEMGSTLLDLVARLQRGSARPMRPPSNPFRVLCVDNHTFLFQSREAMLAFNERMAAGQENPGDRCHDLTIGKVYEVQEVDRGMYRIIDDSGEAYLYPVALFMRVPTYP